MRDEPPQFHRTISFGAVATSCRKVSNTKGEIIFKLHVQVAATLEEALKAGLGAQDWDARAAQEVAAARARGAQLPALVDRKEHRAEFLRRKAERAEAAASSKPRDSELAAAAAAAKAEVPAQHLLGSQAWAPFSAVTYNKGSTRRVWCYPVVKVSRLHAVYVWLLLRELTIQASYQIAAAFLSHLHLLQQDCRSRSPERMSVRC